jgi:hypothetical protein
MAAVAMAASMGIDLIDRNEPPPAAPDQRSNGPSIEDLAKLSEIKPGCDPIEASRAIARALGSAVHS